MLVNQWGEGEKKGERGRKTERKPSPGKKKLVNQKRQEDGADGNLSELCAVISMLCTTSDEYLDVSSLCFH